MFLKRREVPVGGKEIEDSIRLRLAVFANTAAAFVAYATIDPELSIALPIVGVAIGSAFSHWRRRGANVLLKWGLALGMLYVLYVALGNLLRGAMDPRLGLAQLLLALQVLNSFDLPRRRNLRVAVLVATVLIIVTGTLSRTMDYGLLLLAFVYTLVWSSYESFLAETRTPPGSLALTASVTSVAWGLILVASLPLFLLAPRQTRQETDQTLPLSFNIPLPSFLDPKVRNPDLAGRAGGIDGLRADGTRRGYTGFSDHMDLNTRGAPAEEIVLRVRSIQAQYWRAMAFDHYDGRGWTMSEPDAVDVVTSPTQPLHLPMPLGQARGNDELVQTFYVETDQANLVFCAWPPKRLYFPTGMVWRDHYDSVRTPVTLQKDMYYSVVSHTSAFSRAQLATLRAKPLPPHTLKYLALPPVSDRLKALTKRLVQGHSTPFAKMEACREYLTSNYPYRLDIKGAPAGKEWVDFFLFEQKEGFCEQFATSLAVMGRLQGIPTRMATGYVAGDYNPFTGLYEVRGKHAHAWVEAWMPAEGWTSFEATPDAMDLGGIGKKLFVPVEVLRAVGTFIGRSLRAHPWLGALAVIGLLAVLRAAWPSRSPRPAAATKLYRRLRFRLARAGVPKPPIETPREWLAAARRTPMAPDALRDLAAFLERYEAVRFGQEIDGGELARLANQAERSLPAPAGVTADRWV